MKKTKYLISTLVISMLAASLSGCACSKPVTSIEIVATTPTPAPPAPTKAPTNTTAPTATSVPAVTETPVVTEEVKATETPMPTETPTPEPTKHVHEYTAQITEATCLEEGIAVYTCECGDTYTEILPKKDHVAGEPERTEASVDKEGSIIVKCVNCGTILSSEIIEKTTPTPKPTATSTPKPTNTPTPKYSDEYIQSVPTVTEKEAWTYGHEANVKSGDWTGHIDQVTTVKEPTTTEEGIKLHVCTCGIVCKVLIPKLVDLTKLSDLDSELLPVDSVLYHDGTTKPVKRNGYTFTFANGKVGKVVNKGEIYMNKYTVLPIGRTIEYDGKTFGTESNTYFITEDTVQWMLTQGTKLEDICNVMVLLGMTSGGKCTLWDKGDNTWTTYWYCYQKDGTKYDELALRLYHYPTTEVINADEGEIGRCAPYSEYTTNEKYPNRHNLFYISSSFEEYENNGLLHWYIPKDQVPTRTAHFV